MADNTGIEWTDATWNPVTGCTKVSAGCDHCYAETFAERFRGTPGNYYERGFDLQLRPEKLEQPLRWRRPRRIFVNSMSDLFHDQVPDDYIARVFAVMAYAHWHTFQLLTKRHSRMRSLLSSERFVDLFDIEFCKLPDWAPRWPDPDDAGHLMDGPLSNVWLGVSTENQQWADIRIPALLDTPAAVRFVSAEPLLGPIDLRPEWGYGPGIDWIIVGGESGRGARPMHPEWARALRDQRSVVGAAYLFKQWGEWAPVLLDRRETDHDVRYDGYRWPISEPHGAEDGTEVVMRRVGKRRAGRELDGRTWDQYPAAVAHA